MTAWLTPMWRRVLGTALGWGVESLDRVEHGLGDLRRSTAFVRARVLFRPRADDLYVATYPRSGTTWMQFMLHLLVRGEGHDFRHINDVCPWFERSLAIGSLTPEDLERLPSPRIFKTHLPRAWLPRTGRFVGIVRDPADVVVSYFDLYRSYLGFEGSLDDFLRRFERGRVQYGSWWTHTEGWMRHADDPAVMMLRFEQLRAEPATQLRRLAAAFELPTDAARVDAAVEGASLPRMKRLEARFDHASALLLERGIEPRRFIREGRVGDGTRQLTDRQRARLAAAGRRRSSGHSLWLPAFLH